MMLPCEQESDIRNHSKVPSDAPRQVGEDKALSMLTKLCMSDGTGTRNHSAKQSITTRGRLIWGELPADC